MTDDVEPCKECKGQGKIEKDCDNCLGTGYDPTEEKPFAQCHECYGEGEVTVDCIPCDGEGVVIKSESTTENDTNEEDENNSYQRFDLKKALEQQKIAFRRSMEQRSK